MDNAMLPVIQAIISRYGDDAFSNMPRTNAILLDLAPGMLRERMLVRGFVEINGYRQLKNAGEEYRPIKQKLVAQLTDVFCMEREAAEWVTRLFAAALGYESPVMPEDYLHAASANTHIVIPELHSAVAIGKAHIVAAAADGTIFAGGNNDHFQCDVGGWRNIVAVAAGDAHTIGLRADGTVLAAGSNTYDQCDVGHLTGIASVYAFGNDTVCVGLDGTAVATGKSTLDVSHFNQIKTISRYPGGVFGIREDGRVMVASESAASSDMEEEIRWAESLENAKQIISTYVKGSIVLKRDGRIYKMNRPEGYFAQWRDVVSIADLSDSFAILRTDGSVRILPYERGQTRKVTETDAWRDIVAIFGKYKRLLGLNKNGELQAVCTDPDWARRNGSPDFVTGWYPVGSFMGG